MIAKTPGVSLNHWSSCNGVKPCFHKLYRPISVSENPDSFEIWYEDRLVKMADNTGPQDGNDCGLDYLFSDGHRRPLFLQAGYRFYKNGSFVDRMYRYRNEAGNPQLQSDWSLIGGFVITDLNRKIPEKAFYKNFRWTNGLQSSAGNFAPREFKPLASGSPGQDVVVGWAQTSYVASVEPRLGAGISIGLSHTDMGLSKKQEDIGTCICVVHGGFEMGGGVLSGATGAVPLGGGQTSVSNTRRLWLPNSDSFLPGWQ